MRRFLEGAGAGSGQSSSSSRTSTGPSPRCSTSSSISIRGGGCSAPRAVSHGENWSRTDLDGARGTSPRRAAGRRAGGRAGPGSQQRPSTRKTRSEIVRIAGGTALPRAAARIPPGGGSQRARVRSADRRGASRGRLERLDPAERALTERAAVAGRDFSVADSSRYPAGGDRGPRLARYVLVPSRPDTCAAWWRRRHVPLPSRPGPRRRLRGTTKAARSGAA